MSPTSIIMIVLVVGLFFLMFRSNKKQERETAEMRNNLEVGDEITTIGGIIGEIVKIKEETVTIETGKDRTKIGILRSAVRVVDVHAYEKRGDGKKPAPVNPQQANAPVKMEKLKTKADEAPENAEVAPAEVATNNTPKKKKGKKTNNSQAQMPEAETAITEEAPVVEETPATAEAPVEATADSTAETQE